jgi:GH25 family lysozyme M1 (1,4-beta-N-acetylmuramidase)
MSVAALVLAALSVLATAVPASALLSGVDVASFQHPGGAPIDWAAVRASGQSFAFIKATEGTAYTNPYFASDWNASGAAGLYRGAYHFARPALPLSTAVDQARWFVSRTGTMAGAIDLPGVLDLEATGGLGQADLAQWTRIWLAEVTRLTGKAPIVYTGYYFWRDNVGNPVDIGAAYRLWLPSYPSDPNSTTFRPLVPAGWAAWSFWQYSSSGSVPGISGSVDLNRFCCGVDSLGALGGSAAGAGNPFGSLDVVSRSPGTATVSGWTIDPDSSGSVGVHVYVDGAWGGLGAADVSRPDVASAYPGWNDRHGFSVTVPAFPGASQVCVYAINVGSGSTNPRIGCAPMVANPIGNLEGLSSPGAGQVSATGWALDPDTAGPLPVDLYLDGQFLVRTATGGARPDVGLAYPFGGQTGFAPVVAGVSAGAHRVCAYAINVGSGSTNPLIGCGTVTVQGGDPFGNLDVVTIAPGSARVEGWAADVDTAGPTQVRVTVDGAPVATAAADRLRPDVGAAFPTLGASHGYRADVPLGFGTHEICVSAVNVGAGTVNSQIGCRTVTMTGPPVGNLEWIARYYDVVGVSGWAIDPDTSAPVVVTLQVDGVDLVSGPAAGDRPDVGAAYPLYGSAHGFLSLAATAPGPHTVCAVAVDGGPSPRNRLLGCRVL